MKKRQPSTATDHIYLHRHLEFVLDDGSVVSSVDTNFHQIPLHRLIEMRLNIRNQSWRVRKSDHVKSGFVEFLHYRTTGRDYKVNPDTGLYELRPFDSWSLGWTDGVMEYLMEIDFQAGDLIGSYQRPCRGKANPSHYHPQSRILERGARA